MLMRVVAFNVDELQYMFSGLVHQADRWRPKSRNNKPSSSVHDSFSREFEALAKKIGAVLQQAEDSIKTNIAITGQLPLASEAPEQRVSLLLERHLAELQVDGVLPQLQVLAEHLERLQLVPGLNLPCPDDRLLLAFAENGVLVHLDAGDRCPKFWGPVLHRLQRPVVVEG